MRQDFSILKSVISIILVLAMLLSLSATLISCDIDDAGTDNETPPENGSIVIDGVEIKEAFVEIDFKEIVLNAVDVKEINVEEIKVNPAIIKEIMVIETQVTTINDEFVYLAYQNFVDYYGDDVDWEQFIKDIAIGATVVIVMVTLSTVAGPVGTFFGAVVCSEFSAAAIVVGAAIDAAISGYLAYQEGGDASYILGHMLNGVADGFKWGAILAPVSFAGGKVIEKGAKAIKGAINGMRATSKAAKIAALNAIPTKQVAEVLYDMPNIVKYTANLADNAADTAVKNAYKAASKEISQEITEDVFLKAFRSKSALLQIVKELNPYDIADKVLKVSQESYLKKAATNITDEAVESLIKQLKNGALKSINDITDDAVKQLIKETPGQFVELFGKRMSKELLDNVLKETVGGEAIVKSIAESITKKTAYAELVEKIGKETADRILSSGDSLYVLQAKYGAKNLTNLLNSQKLYNALLKNNKIDHKEIKAVVEGLLAGTIKSTSDIASLSVDGKIVSSQIVSNMISGRDVISQTLKNMKLGKANASLLNDLAIAGFKYAIDEETKNILTDDVLTNVIKNSYTKSQLPDDVYKHLVKNAQTLLESMKLQNAVNKSLVNDLVVDALKESDIPESAITQIMKGSSINVWGLTEKQIGKISNLCSSYYQALDPNTYYNFVAEIPDIRSNLIKEFIEQYEANGNTVRNKAKYAGKIMEPTGDLAKIIKDKYGDILMTKTGFPVFDKYAVARIVSDGLTGTMDDIKKIANMLHHGTEEDIVGYTWHHLEDGKTLILIPRELHEAYRHTGGADLIREGLEVVT